MDILFDRCVKFIDEVEAMIQERGDQTRDQTITKAQSTLDAAVARHEADVEAPALAILRGCKAAAAASHTTSSSSRWRKEPVTFADNAGYYRKLLDGVEPVLPQQLAAAPAVNSLTLRVSVCWPPRHCCGFIASSHDNLLALCVGSYRDDGGYCYRRNLPGFYLVLDTHARSIAVVPPLPDGWLRFVDDVDHSHYPIGSAGVAVLRTGVQDGGGYLLAELYRHTDRYRENYLSTNKATLFMWSSPGSSSGPRAKQWIRTEVVLPLPLPGPDEDGYYFNFNPETVFAVSSTSLCWVDVRAGILVCNNSSSSSFCSTDAAAAAAAAADGLVFRFIPLPEGSAPASFGSREYRSVCCVDSETIKLLCMDDDEEVTVAFTTWTLKSPLSADGWRWEKDEDASCSSLCVADLLDEAIPVDGGSRRRLLRRVVRWPVVGRAQPGVAHVSVADYEYKRKGNCDNWEARGCYEVSLDVPRRRVASSVFTFPAGSSSPAHMDMVMAL